MPDGLLIDIAGVLHVGDHALLGAAAALARLEAERIPHLFITNTTRRPAPALAAQLGRLGLPVPVERILSAVDATVVHLQARQLRPHLLVHRDVRAAFDVCDQRSPNAVVLGDAGDGFDYAALNRAFRLLMEGAALVAMGDNRYFRGDDGLMLDIGPFRVALEYASGRTATVIGKPVPAFFLAGCARLGLAPAAVTMIGDDAEADVAAALAAGLGGCLVRTGKFAPGDAAKCPGAPVCADLGDALDTLFGTATAA